jgi:hypothetical protein
MPAIRPKAVEISLARRLSVRSQPQIARRRQRRQLHEPQNKKLKGSVTFKRVFLLEVAAVLLAVLGFLTAFEIVDITISQKVVDATSMFEEVNPSGAGVC